MDDLSLTEGVQGIEGIEDTIVVAPTKLSVKIARVISILLSPVVISVPFIMLAALYHASNRRSALLFALLALFFLTVGPMTYIGIGVLLGKFTDVDVSVRSQRFGPFIFILISAMLSLFVIRWLHGPRELQLMIVVTVILGLVMTLITLWWKISIHASSMAAALTFLIALYGTIIFPGVLLLVAVCWSRVVLKRHTLAQVIAGSLLSSALTCLVLLVVNVQF